MITCSTINTQLVLCHIYNQICSLELLMYRDHKLAKVNISYVVDSDFQTSHSMTINLLHNNMIEPCVTYCSKLPIHIVIQWLQL